MNKKEIKKAKKAVKITAEKENLPIGNVREEMKAAIGEGLRNPDPKVQEMWKKIPCKGETPEPEELIAWLAEQVKETLKNNS